MAVLGKLFWQELSGEDPLGLYLVDDGQDGCRTNVSQIRPEDMRANFGIVHQNVALFSGTIRDNIALASMITKMNFW